MAVQNELPLAVPPRSRRGRRAKGQLEDPAIYQAVLTLRRRGHRVFRAGADHWVDGEPLATPAMLALAARPVAPPQPARVRAQPTADPPPASAPAIPPLLAWIERR